MMPANDTLLGAQDTSRPISEGNAWRFGVERRSRRPCAPRVVISETPAELWVESPLYPRRDGVDYG